MAVISGVAGVALVLALALISVEPTPPPVGLETSLPRLQPGSPEGGSPAHGGVGGSLSPSIDPASKSSAGEEGNKAGEPGDPEAPSEGAGKMEHADLGLLIERLIGGSYDDSTFRRIRDYSLQFGKDYTHGELVVALQRAPNKSALAMAVARVAAPGALDALMFLLSGGAPEERSAAVQALLVLGNRQCLPRLRGLARDDGDVGVRKEVCSVLGKMRDEESVDLLIDLLADPDRGISSTARWSLGAITGRKFGPNQAEWREWRRKKAGG